MCALFAWWIKFGSDSCENRKESILCLRLGTRYRRDTFFQPCPAAYVPDQVLEQIKSKYFKFPPPDCGWVRTDDKIVDIDSNPDNTALDEIAKVEGG